MSNKIYENLEIIDIYLKNQNQKIFLCKDKETEGLLLLNGISNRKVIEGVDISDLQSIIGTIKSFEEVEENTYILTNNLEYPTIQEYLSNNRITLSKQVGYVGVLLDYLMRLKSLPLYILSSLFTSTSIKIDVKGEMQLSGLIIINDNYLDISTREIIHNLADIIHVIFTGNEMIDNTLGRNIPPDIQTIISNCINNRYLKFSDLLSDFKASKLYRLINPETEEGRKVHLIRRNLYTKRLMHNLKKKTVIVALILMILAPVILLNAGKFIKANTRIGSRNEDTIPSNHEGNIGGEDDQSIGTNTDPAKDEDTDSFFDDGSDKENLYYYYNEKLIELGKGEKLGVIDSETYHKGEYSIKVSSDNNIRNVYLVGGIDLENNYFNFLNGRDVNTSMWLTADKETEATIMIKLLDGEKIISQMTKKVTIPSDYWILHNMDFSTIKGKYIKIYISTQDKVNIWVDSFDVDLLK